MWLRRRRIASTGNDLAVRAVESANLERVDKIDTSLPKRATPGRFRAIGSVELGDRARLRDDLTPRSLGPCCQAATTAKLA